MISWQKRARFGLALFASVFAVLVYRSIGERQAAAPPPAVDRVDPKAILETTAAILQRVRGTEQEFEIKSARSLTYADGAARHFDVEIIVRGAGGRDFVVTAKEASAGPNQVELKLDGDVLLSASDGFQLRTGSATFNQNDGVARVPGSFTFGRGTMDGSGVGATYDQRHDVLHIEQQAAIRTIDQGGRTVMDSRAGAAALDRTQHVLFMESGVHVQRDGQVIEADRGMAQLSAAEDVVTRLELRGQARVSGGEGPVESMRASGIDMDYTEDGEQLERVILNDGADVRLARHGPNAGRAVSAESLDLQLAADGALTGLTGRGRVRLDLPAGEGVPARSIRAGTLSATGEPGRGLTAAEFREDVAFQEDDGRQGQSRTARAQSLTLALSAAAVTRGLFSGGVVFDDRSLRASGGAADYRPGEDLLQLSGTHAGRGPRVADDRISVDADVIEVVLDGHAMTARGEVRTSVGDSRPLTLGGDDSQGGRLPGLLQRGSRVSVNADAFDYSGDRGRAVYSGHVTLVQGDTAIRSDELTLDRLQGDLVATGSARSTLRLGKGRTEGRAHEIRYDEAARVLTYSAEPATPTTRTGPASAAAVPRAQLSGPEGDLQAERLEIVLAARENRLERLDGYGGVTLIQGARTATGTRLTYHALDERYEMSGGGITPVTIREACRETTGRTLTFFKSTDRIVVDGNETRRTQTRPCAEPSR